MLPVVTTKPGHRHFTVIQLGTVKRLTHPFVDQAFVDQAFVDQELVDQAFVDQELVDQELDFAVAISATTNDREFGSLKSKGSGAQKCLHSPHVTQIFPHSPRTRISTQPPKAFLPGW